MPDLITVNSLQPTDYQPYFQTYIDLVPDEDVRKLLSDQIESFCNLYGRIDEEVSLVVHPPYLWTIRQVVGHLIDGEKLFGCRAHRIATGENQSLPGFDQDLFVANVDYSSTSLEKLVEEFLHIRHSNILMFDRFNDQMWQQSGDCDGKPMSVGAIACILVGHVNHHARIVENRIGKDSK